MNIAIEFDYLVSQSSLPVNVTWPTGNTTLNLNQFTPKLEFDFALPIQNQTVELVFSCKNLNIVNHPLTITNITLDDFYSLPKILYSGVPIFDQMFLLYAKKKNIVIDQTVADVNRLDFTGTLTYQFVWPFYKNVFK
jgi:hypothetical protein